MQVYLVGVRGDDYRGDIAVDDIFFKQCGNNIILKEFIFYNYGWCSSFRKVFHDWSAKQ